MRRISQAVEIIGMLDRGDLNADLTKVFRDVVAQLQEQASDKRKVVGTITLKLRLEVQGKSIDIEPSIDFKVPKPARGRSTYFLTPDAELSLDHPNQEDLFKGPRPAETLRSS